MNVSDSTMLTFFSLFQTITKAIDAGYLTMFSSITLQQVRKHPPCSEATVKYHLKVIKKVLKYSQITSPRINNTIATS